ncbi:MAG: TrkA family potassium uptake protein [Methanomicrobia archaeon]|jgi:trk system potassium uptake protein TrkA|nr:TrkA family potassium uptake protein [Methanomicrobia archaeon]MCK4433005.1 TrkA family potassium uptake protein [Methanomicrobia archaeon]MCK4636655.1 TrkA family potassium uptake protein [Methanomicrobia archaeon]
MYIIVVGGGRIGFNLSKLLVKAGHEVTVIEKDRERSNFIANEIDALVLNEDGTTIKALEEANIEDGYALVALTKRDEINLMACLLARDYGVPVVVARISDPENSEVFRKLGVSAVVSPELTTAIHIEKLIMRPDVIDLTVVAKGQAEILEMIISKDSPVVGKKLKDISPRDFLVIAVYNKEGDLTIPKGNTQLNEGNRILVLAKTRVVPLVKKMFME